MATDIAARGIDVDAVSHVVNFELPEVAESYVHRIGRTARAGAEGVAISLCDNSERAYLRAIEKLTKQSIPVDRPAPRTRMRPRKRPRRAESRRAARRIAPTTVAARRRRATATPAASTAASTRPTGRKAGASVRVRAAAGAPAPVRRSGGSAMEAASGRNGPRG